MSATLLIVWIGISTTLFGVTVLVYEWRRHSAWQRRHDEMDRNVRFWTDRCHEAVDAYRKAPAWEKDAKRQAMFVMINRYEKEVMMK